MKRWLAWWWAVALLLTACGGGGGSAGSNPSDGALSVGAVTAVTLLPREGRVLPVSGGVPPYRVVSAEEAIALATLDGNRLIIGGRRPGSTQVTVSDRAGSAVNLTVTVGSNIPLYTTAPAALQLGVGPSEARIFRVDGGVKPYVITGNAPLVARVTQLDDEQWRIEGVAIGELVVRIRDDAGSELEIAVTVGSPELRVFPDALTLPLGTPATVVLSGGQKPYRIAGGIPAAIRVRALSYDTFQIEGLLATDGVDVVFADATGKPAKVTVTVTTATTQIRVSPSEVTLGERSGREVKFLVYTAAPGDLSVFSSNLGLVSISQVSAPTFNPDGTINTPGSFVGTVSGTTCVSEDTPVTITVVDSNGSVGTATVTVSNADTACPS